jgi:hypothetical protein
MVQRVYSHLGTIRHRSEAVEYRVEQHRRALEGSRRSHFGGAFGTTVVTALAPRLLPRSPARLDLRAGHDVRGMGDEGLEPPTSRM